MGMIIDTNIFIDAEHGRFELNHLHRFSHYGEAFISVITMSELLTGAHMAKSVAERVKRHAFVGGILSHIPVLSFTEETARTYAELCAYMLKSKNILKRNAHDLQIAATAIHYGYPILTRNQEDFRKIPGLMTEFL